jgi:hypothetical protein
VNRQRWQVTAPTGQACLVTVTDSDDYERTARYLGRYEIDRLYGRLFAQSTLTVKYIGRVTS